MSELKAIPYRFDRDPEVIELLEKVFSPWTGGQDYFNWKYKRFTEKQCSFPNAWIIKDDNKIIAFNGYIPRLIRCKDDVYWAVQSFDTATDPNYRGKGLFGLLQNQAYDLMRQHNISWVYGWTSEIGFKVFTKKMGWTIWGKQHYLMKPLDTESFTRSKVSNPYAAFAASKLLSAWNKVTSPGVPTGYRIEYLKSLPMAAGKLIKKHNSMYSMAAQKSVEYVNWRASNPIDRLSFVAVHDKNMNLEGYAAFSLRDNCLDIDDIVADKNSVIKILLAAFEVQAQKKACSMIRFRVNSEHPAASVFKRCGYFWSHTQFPLLGKKLSKDDFQTEEQNLHWTIFDRNE